jgi:hypothetical protein
MLTNQKQALDGVWRDNMKKTMIAVLMALMLITSVMPAFADRDTDIRMEGRVDDGIGIGVAASGRTNATDDNPQRNETTRREGRDRAEDRQELMDGLRAEHRIRVEALKMRVIGHERMELALERVKEHKDRLKELKEEYKERRDDVKEAREKADDACKNRRNATECKKARDRFNENSKMFVGNAADQMLTIIAAMKERVDANPHIDNATALKVTAQLDARAAAIVAAQAKLNTTNNTQEAATELREAWQDARVTIRLTEGLLAHARFQEFLDRLDNMETRLREVSVQLKAEGKDTTQLDADINDFSAKLDIGTQTYANARDSYVTAMADVDTEAEANTLVKATHEQLKAAQDDLKEARNELRAVIKDLRELDASKLAAVAAQISADAKASATVENSEVAS